jgi:putative ABC transport system ATP-binding protein
MTRVVLVLRDVVKHYPGGEVVRAVDGVSLDVRAGELVALYGPSGSGKTTLLQMAGGYVRPDAGAVCFDGRDVTAFSARERSLYQRRDIGLIQQRFHLAPGASIVDNAVVKLLADGIALHEARRHAIPWLERVGLGERLHHTPSQLSGGEGQRVALARALVNEPPLVLADEPTAYLDRRRGGEILALLASLAHERGTAVLLVTHDPEAATFADRVHALTDGQLGSAEDPRPAAAIATVVSAGEPVR